MRTTGAGAMLVRRETSFPGRLAKVDREPVSLTIRFTRVGRGGVSPGRSGAKLALEIATLVFAKAKLAS
ncbi:MAG: hypothetical protein M3O46_12070 [Myxococcota bacterium]|nr:hypothetical protein [Myxococcota bacterium]